MMQAVLPFDGPLRPLKAISTPSPESRPRLQRACFRILDRLADGRATNRDLLECGGIRFGARVKELRDSGFDIRTVEVDKVSGRVVYEWVR